MSQIAGLCANLTLEKNCASDIIIISTKECSYAMANLPEIIVVNGIGVCLVCFLFMTMTQKNETRFITHKLFILMISIPILNIMNLSWIK